MKFKDLKAIFVLTLLFLLKETTSVMAADTIIYVSPTSPECISKAIRQAREFRRVHVGAQEYLQLNNKSAYPKATIVLSPGTYRLYEPICLRPEDSNLEIRGTGNVVISGGIKITNWKKSGKLWVADVPDFNGRPFDFRQLWINGHKAIRARSVSDFEKMPRIVNYDRHNRILWVPTSAVSAYKLNKRSSPYLEMILHEMWCVSVLRVSSITVYGDSTAIRFQNPEARIQFEHPWPSPMYQSKHDSPFFFTNSLALLDKPGEWYHDIRSGKLYYMPEKGENMRDADVEAPALETLVDVSGTSDRKVDNVTFSSVRFSYTSWMRPSFQGHVPLQAGMYLTEAYRLKPKIERPNNHKLDNQGWLGRAVAAVEVHDADGINFEGCRFEHLGGSGLDYVIGCNGGTTRNCTFRDIAMNGYVSGSFSTDGLETHLPYFPVDQREVCRNQQVVNNLFTDVSDEDWGCVGIAAGYVSDINIAHNTIHHVSYTGISLGWGWNRDSTCMKNNRVYANLVYDYARHVYDCAGIYTLGNQPGTMISENVIRDIAHPSYVHDPDHWFYLYTDEGSSHITLKDNWTPTDKYLKNATGPDDKWIDNGPQVPEVIKNRAGCSLSR